MSLYYSGLYVEIGILAQGSVDYIRKQCQPSLQRWQAVDRFVRAFAAIRFKSRGTAYSDQKASLG